MTTDASTTPTALDNAEALKNLNELIAQLYRHESDLIQKISGAEAGTEKRQQFAEELMNTIGAIRKWQDQRRQALRP